MLLMVCNISWPLTAKNKIKRTLSSESEGVMVLSCLFISPLSKQADMHCEDTKFDGVGI